MKQNLYSLCSQPGKTVGASVQFHIQVHRWCFVHQQPRVEQRTLTPPDTWSCPTLGLACVLMSRPISPKLVLSPDFWISNTPRYFSFAYLGQMYPAELEIKDTTESNISASYLDLLLSIGGTVNFTLNDKRDDFNFHITNFPFLSSNIPTSPAYGVFISQLIRHARACSSYGCFILRATRLSNKLLEQGYAKERLKS